MNENDTEITKIMKFVSKGGVSVTEALNNVPVYARKEALEAIINIKELEDKKFYQPGLHYVVLVDLSGSTKASAELGYDINKQRIEFFIKQTIKALSEIDLNNSRAFFVKEIGDASLFIFSNFGDIINWSTKLDELLASCNSNWEIENKPDIYKMFTKKCIHVGEVHYSDKSNPVAFAVNQVFKIEKLFKKGDIGFTDIVREIIRPLIKSGAIRIEKVTDTALQEDNIEKPIWRIIDYEELYRGGGR